MKLQQLYNWQKLSRKKSKKCQISGVQQISAETDPSALFLTDCSVVSRCWSIVTVWSVVSWGDEFAADAYVCDGSSVRFLHFLIAKKIAFEKLILHMYKALNHKMLPSQD